MDLFDYMQKKKQETESPLASRLRPRTLDEVVGQQHIIGRGRLLYRAIRADKLTSVIFYGPPGTGKTTLARVIANTTNANFRQLNATTSGKKDMEQVVAEAKEALGGFGRRTILFIDEIHRFNKSQQDYLLPFVEDGTVILIGATTENPYFEVNSALLSRSTIFELHPLSREDVAVLLDRAMTDRERGLGAMHAKLLPEARDFLADVAGGDARSALNAIELAAMTTEPDENGEIIIDLDVASDCIQKRAVHYDKNGEQHYDTISAFIKSMERVGMPEARIPLAEAAIYVANAPKSNAAYEAIGRALDSVARVKTSVPGHLKNIHANGEGDVPQAVGYKYAHDYPDHWVDQQYLPDEIRNEKFYVPGEIGHEAETNRRLREVKQKGRQNG